MKYLIEITIAILLSLAALIYFYPITNHDAIPLSESCLGSDSLYHKVGEGKCVITTNSAETTIAPLNMSNAYITIEIPSCRYEGKDIDCKEIILVKDAQKLTKKSKPIHHHTAPACHVSNAVSKTVFS